MTTFHASTAYVSPFQRASSLTGAGAGAPRPPVADTPPVAAALPVPCELPRTVEAHAEALCPVVAPRKPSRFHIVTETRRKPPALATDCDKHIPVFVYGSLLPGLHNNWRMDDAVFLGYYNTKPMFDMYSFGGFPGVCSEGHTAITGALYRVGPKTLRSLDQLEGHPKWYCRQPVALPETGLRAWMYIMPREEIMPSCNPFVEGGNWRTYLENSSGNKPAYSFTL